MGRDPKREVTAMVRLPFFGPWFQRQQVEAIQRDAEALCGLLRQLLDDVLPEQQARLRTIRQTGPWDVEHEAAVRQQAERAGQVVQRLRQYRALRQRLADLEEQLPPARGWGRLRYANPWVVTWALCGLSLLVSGLRLWLR